MNEVCLIGRLVKDPEERRAGETTVCNFTLAIDRIGKEKQADYPRIIVFGKTAENCIKYLAKGKLAGVTGRIQTGSYEKDGQRIYTTDVVANRVEFLSPAGKSQEDESPLEDFEAVQEAIPF